MSRSEEAVSANASTDCQIRPLRPSTCPIPQVAHEPGGLGWKVAGKSVSAFADQPTATATGAVQARKASPPGIEQQPLRLPIGEQISEVKLFPIQKHIHSKLQ